MTLFKLFLYRCNGVRGWFPSNYVEIIKVYTDSDVSGSRPHDSNTTLVSLNSTLVTLYSTLFINIGQNSSDSQGDDRFRPTSQQISRPTTLLFDDQLEQNAPDSSVPSSCWTIETPKDGSLAYHYYNQRTGEMVEADTEDTTILDDYDDDNTSTSDMDFNDDLISPTNSPYDISDFGRHQPYSPGSLHTDTGSSSSDNNNGNSWGGDGGNWMNNGHSPEVSTMCNPTLSTDIICNQLPTPWVKKTVADRGVCYYNLATHEIAWDINDIMHNTGERRVS